jgi:uncharacterized protein YdiU (UPF0061 family)
MSMLRNKPAAEGKNDWNVDTLREHLISLIASNDIRYSQRFEASQSALNTALTAQQTAMQTALTAQKLAVDTAQAAAEKAVTKAELSAEKRFESVNEFRATLSDQQRTLMPRSEAELLIKTLADKIDTNTANLTVIAGHKSGTKDLWGYIIGAAGFASAVIFHFIK